MQSVHPGFGSNDIPVILYVYNTILLAEMPLSSTFQFPKSYALQPF